MDGFVGDSESLKLLSNELIKSELFGLLSIELTDNGYQIEHRSNEHASIAIVAGNGIKGVIDDRGIAIDAKNLYNKPADCPLRLPLPRSQRQREWLISRMQYWASKEGQELSRKYAWDYFDREYGVH